MTKREMRPYNAAKYLMDDEMVQAYLAATLKMGDLGLAAKALGTIAQARAMTQLVVATGIDADTLWDGIVHGRGFSADQIGRVAQAMALDYPESVSTRI
jgi:probable addiction module antidote protein